MPDYMSINKMVVLFSTDSKGHSSKNKAFLFHIVSKGCTCTTHDAHYAIIRQSLRKK